MQASQQLSRPRLAEQTPGRALPPVTHRPSPIYFAAIFRWTMAAVSAVMVAIVRWPLGSPHWFVFVKAFLLPCAVIACATLFTVRHVERGGAYSALLVSTIAVIFLPCLAWLNGPLADVVIYPLFLGLLVAGLAQTASAMRAAPISMWAFAVACGCLAGFGYFLVINSRAFASVLTPELALTGIHQLDTIFHASIANMLVKYGVLSTGLDGLLPIKYHVLSHICSAASVFGSVCPRWKATLSACKSSPFRCCCSASRSRSTCFAGPERSRQRRPDHVGFAAAALCWPTCWDGLPISSPNPISSR